MDHPITVNTLAELIATRTRELGHRPLVTVYDDTVGARTELSYATADNWAAKTANLLVEELDLHPGALVALDVDGHWTAVVLTLACWKAGVAVTRDGGGADVVCCHVARLPAHPDGPLLVVGDGMRAEPLGSVPARDGVVLLGDDVHAFADEHDAAGVQPTTPAVVTPTITLDHRAVLAHVRRPGQAVADGARVGVLGALDDVGAQVLLAGVMAAGASLVAARPAPQAPPWDRWSTERVTVAAGPPAALAAAPDGIDTVELVEAHGP